MNIRPLFDKVLVKKEEIESRTESGLFTPVAADKQYHIATVISHGPKVQAVLVNDKVYFSKYAGMALDNGYMIVKEEEIVAII